MFLGHVSFASLHFCGDVVSLSLIKGNVSWTTFLWMREKDIWRKELYTIFNFCLTKVFWRFEGFWALRVSFSYIMKSFHLETPSLWNYEYIFIKKDFFLRRHRKKILTSKWRFFHQPSKILFSSFLNSKSLSHMFMAPKNRRETWDRNFVDWSLKTKKRSHFNKVTPFIVNCLFFPGISTSRQMPEEICV